MRRGFILALVALGLSSPAAAGDLFYYEKNERPQIGKPLIMRFAETKRDAHISTAVVTFISGASVPSIMFVVCGFHAIAKQRQAAYMFPLGSKEAPDGSWVHMTGFAKRPDIDAKRYFGIDYAPVQPMRVADFDHICQQ